MVVCGPGLTSPVAADGVDRHRGDSCWWAKWQVGCPWRYSTRSTSGSESKRLSIQPSPFCTGLLTSAPVSSSGSIKTCPGGQLEEDWRGERDVEDLRDST